MSWNWQQFKVIIEFAFDCFGSQTDVIAFDVGFEIVLKSRLVIFFGNKFLTLSNSKMTSWWVVIMLADKLYFDSFRYEEEALMV